MTYFRKLSVNTCFFLKPILPSFRLRVSAKHIQTCRRPVTTTNSLAGETAARTFGGSAPVSRSKWKVTASPHFPTFLENSQIFSHHLFHLLATSPLSPAAWCQRKVCTYCIIRLMSIARCRLQQLAGAGALAFQIPFYLIQGADTTCDGHNVSLMLTVKVK